MEPEKNPLTATEGTEAGHPRPPEPRAGVTGDILADPAGQLPQSSQTTGITLRQYAILVAAGAFATTFAQQRVLGNYPTLFLLKDDLHLAREQVALFFFWASFAWNLKPLAGIFTDAFPLLGTRRRSYMILGSLAAGVLWLVMGLYPHNYQALLIASVAMNAATVVASTVMGGLMVEAGQAFAAPGRIAALRQFVQSVASLVAPPLGGWLASQAFGWSATTTIAAVTVLALAGLTAVVLHEKPTPPAEADPANVGERPRIRIPLGALIGFMLLGILGTWMTLLAETRQGIGYPLDALFGMGLLILGLIVLPSHNPVIHRAQRQLAQILESRTLWLAVFMLFLVYTVPGLGTALTYRQEDELKFSKPFIGMLDSIAGGLGMAAAVGYGLLCRRLNLRILLVTSIAANAAATLLYLYYTRGTAPWIHGLGGVVGVLSELALMDLAVRSTPKGCEALGFSLMMSVRNFGIALSDVLGSKLIDEKIFTFNNLVLVNAATTFVILLFVPLLPRLVMSQKEGEGGAPQAEPAE